LEEADGADLLQPKGLIYMNLVPRGKTVNAVYIEALTRFLRVLKE
jgi:hypothetical protein